MTINKSVRGKLDKAVERLDDTAMTTEDFERVVSGASSEALAFRQQKRKVRYRLTRIQTMVNGGCDAEDSDNLKERFEAMPNFDGWRNWKVTWDVALDDPFKIVHKDKSAIEEWGDVVRAKFPQIEPGTGKITYPDVKTKKLIDKRLKEAE